MLIIENPGRSGVFLFTHYKVFSIFAKSLSMRLSPISVLPLLFLVLGSFTKPNQDNIEFVCMKKQMAPNHCHYNFIVDGGKYRYVDIGCRFKKDYVIQNVKEGSLGLARDWKIACQMPAEKKDPAGY
jgi:hypothetical protein